MCCWGSHGDNIIKSIWKGDKAQRFVGAYARGMVSTRGDAETRSLYHCHGIIETLRFKEDQELINLFHTATCMPSEVDLIYCPTRITHQSAEQYSGPAVYKAAKQIGLLCTLLYYPFHYLTCSHVQMHKFVHFRVKRDHSDGIV